MKAAYMIDRNMIEEAKELLEEVKMEYEQIEEDKQNGDQDDEQELDNISGQIGVIKKLELSDEMETKTLVWNLLGIVKQMSHDHNEQIEGL